MNTQFFLLIITIFLKHGNSQDKEAQQNDKIFLNNLTRLYCDLRCGEDIHTMCEINTVELNRSFCGSKFKVYDMEKGSSAGNFFYTNDYIIEGFNGLRNRIAQRMQVANMIKVKHDKYLEKMARNILLRCKDYITKDRCIQFGPVEPGIRDYSTVVMTSFSQEVEFLHPHFIQYVLGTWYSEKNYMERPAFPPDINPDSPDEIGAISINNNFTYLAHPDIEKMGCQLLRHKNIYQFLCVMWPYVGNRFTYKNGHPTRKCPNEYPVKDTTFDSLCTGFSFSEERVVCSFALIVFCLVWILFF